MGALDSFLKAMKMNTDVDDYGDYEYDDSDLAYDEAESKKSFDEKPKKSNKVASFSQKKKSVNSGMEIKSCKPTSIEEASDITDELLYGNSVIINVTGVDVENARQIIDFTSGSVYALRGTLKKITDSIFVAVPAGINIEGAFADKSED